jgi:integrase/recombinase XerD
MPKNNRHGQAAILSDSDYAKIRKHLVSDSHKLFWDIARFTGERWGAIAQLQVRDVYRDPVRSIPHDYITFRKMTRKATPTGERFTRQIPVHPALRDILRAYRPALESEWLFPGVQPNTPITQGACDEWLRRSIAKAGLVGKGISTHSTRRSFITRLAEQGIDIKTIQKLTGHRDARCLLGYVEVSEQRLRMAIATL